MSKTFKILLSCKNIKQGEQFFYQHIWKNSIFEILYLLKFFLKFYKARQVSVAASEVSELIVLSLPNPKPAPGNSTTLLTLMCTPKFSELPPALLILYDINTGALKDYNQTKWQRGTTLKVILI